MVLGVPGFPRLPKRAAKAPKMEVSLLIYISQAKSLRFAKVSSSITSFILPQSRQIHPMPYAAKAKTQQFTRRKPNLFKKADQLAQLCHTDVALIIHRNGRYNTYRSTDYEQGPPTLAEIVSDNMMYRS